MADEIPIPDVSQLPDQSAPNQFAMENANVAMAPPAAPPPQGGPPPPGIPPQAGPTANPSALKGLLTNFFGGMGRAMMVHAGLPTPEEEQQKAQQQATQQQLDQSTIQYHQALAKNLHDQNELVAVPQGPDANGNPQEPLWIARRSQAAVLNKQAGLAQQAKFQEANDLLSAAGKGFQFAIDPNTGKPTIQPMTNEQLSPVQQAGIEAKKRGPTNEAALTIRSLQGDPEAKAAIDQIQGRRMDLVKARGASMNQRPLYQIQSVVEGGVPKLMTGFQVLEAQKEGRILQRAGGLGAKDILTVQRLQSESAPALEGVRSTIGTYDNSNDRAIYARVLSKAGAPEVGGESGWMTNIINQAATNGLSPEGQKQAIALRRLADTMGTMRSLMGLQSTDQAMSLTLSLLPGASTPSSGYAKQQIDQLEGMIKQAVELPALGGARTPTNGGPPSGGGFTKFTDNGRGYTVPNHLVDKFKKAHPNAH